MTRDGLRYSRDIMAEWISDRNLYVHCNIVFFLLSDCDKEKCSKRKAIFTVRPQVQTLS